MTVVKNCFFFPRYLKFFARTMTAFCFVCKHREARAHVALRF